MVLEKTSYFFVEKVDFRGVPPLRPVFVIIIIMLVGKMDILKMSKMKSVKSKPSQKQRDTVYANKFIMKKRSVIVILIPRIRCK